MEIHSHWEWQGKNKHNHWKQWTTSTLWVVSDYYVFIWGKQLLVRAQLVRRNPLKFYIITLFADSLFLNG